MGECYVDTETGKPECRIPATIDPAGFLRFAVSENQANDIFEELVEEYESTDDDLVPIRFILDEQAREDLVTGLKTLEGNLPQMGAAHIALTAQPMYYFTVLVSDEQIIHTLQDYRDGNQKPVTDGGTNITVKQEDVNEQELTTQEFLLSKKATIVTIRQIEEAFDGASNPVEAIDMDKIRNDTP